MIIRLTLMERFLHRLHLLPTPIMDAFGNVVFGRALAIAVRRGLFEALATTPGSAAELAAATNLDRNATELLLQSFVAGGYLKSDGERYRLTGESHRWLLKGSPSYLGNLIRYFETLHARWGYLEQSLEQGSPPQRYFDMFSDDDWKVYVLAMRDLARVLLPRVIRNISLADRPEQLLDLGGSHGLYAVECCRRYPTLKATIVDLPGALRYAHQVIHEEGMSERVRLLPGDFSQIDLPGTQDCVLMFNVIHGFNEETNRGIMCRVLKVLKPGGRLYILDQMREERGKTGLSHFMPLMVGLNLLNEIGGNTYSLNQVQGWCEGAVRVKRIRLHLPGVCLVEVTR